MIGHMLRHGDELDCLIIEGMIKGTRSKTKYISQIMKDAEVIAYTKINDMANDRERHLL